MLYIQFSPKTDVFNVKPERHNSSSIILVDLIVRMVFNINSLRISYNRYHFEREPVMN